VSGALTDYRHVRCTLAHKTLDGGRPDARQLSAHDHRATARCPAQQRVDVACCHCGPGISRGGVGTAQPCALLFGAAAKQHQFGVWGVRKAHTMPAGEHLVGEDPSMRSHCPLPGALRCRRAGDDRVVQNGQRTSRLHACWVALDARDAFCHCCQIEQVRSLPCRGPRSR
jgi:hypothetical protein